MRTSPFPGLRFRFIEDGICSPCCKFQSNFGCVSGGSTRGGCRILRSNIVSGDFVAVPGKKQEGGMAMMAAAMACSLDLRPSLFSHSSISCLRQQQHSNASFFCARTSSSMKYRRTIPLALASVDAAPSYKVFHGACFVLPDNIDTDQIIPAEHLTLVPSKPDEYEKLGSFALSGLPSVHGRFIEEGKTKTKYAVIVAGSNFGCGSSREHAPVALGASGVKAVVAESYARIFFRNSVATGELYPLESEGYIASDCKTGDIVTVDIEKSIFINHTQNKQFPLKPLGDAGPVIDAGGLFAYARATGMIAAA